MRTHMLNHLCTDAKIYSAHIHPRTEREALLNRPGRQRGQYIMWHTTIKPEMSAQLIAYQS
jgi:hypothetical protein